jgi:hypothetical protein
MGLRIFSTGFAASNQALRLLESGVPDQNDVLFFGLASKKSRNIGQP